jgi:hypothetical protein
MGTKSASQAMSEFALSFVADVTAMIVKQAALNAIVSGLGLSGFSTGGSIAVGGAASGANFTVRGTGGTDSQLVAFRASPGERVDISTPGQQAKGGGGINLTSVVHNYAPNTRARQEVADGPAGPELRKIIEQVTASDLERGGPIARTLARTHGVNRTGRRG